MARSVLPRLSLQPWAISCHFPNVKSLTRFPTGDWSGQEPAPDRYWRYPVTGGVTQRPPGNLPLIGGGTHRSRTSVADDKHAGSMRARRLAGKPVVRPLWVTRDLSGFCSA